MSSTTFNSEVRDYNELNFKDLRIACRDYQPKKIGSDGNKKDLILRLCAADAARGQARLQELEEKRVAHAKAESEEDPGLFVQEDPKLEADIKEVTDFLAEVKAIRDACNANPKLTSA
ncbi:uncharacterized protein PAC_15273 [Phialocephala subalpina]|uniref:SAP domain-containing protein n=1 Tax=Phialocephala subalpina TaxID=576137 RepID=A0A1L7XK36_9HELO|nr:uncharacterized protein PAC_15273 [Phialocephala subalpina]